jgi:copper homeostasis protein (lipoprotein)
MKSTKVILITIFLALSIGCGSKQSVPTQNQPKTDSIVPKDTTAKTKQPQAKPETYQGTLPCKKCQGMDVYLTIAADYQSAEADITHSDNPNVDKGYSYTLNTERGYEKDPDATVYILNWDKPENEQWIFVRETGNDSTIFEIGTNRKRFKDKKNHSLKKVQQ